MYLFLSIFIFLFLAQLVMGIFAFKIKKSLKNKYSYYLGEQIEFNKILETYSSNSPNLKIIASEEINDACIADDNLIIINKKSIYAKDLYSNLYLLFQLKLTNPSLKEIRNIYSYQIIVFFAQFVSIILFFLLESIASTILIISYVLLLLSIFLSIYGIAGYNKVLNSIMIEAKTLLKLDRVEEARAETLINEIRYEVLTYPIEIPWRLTRFFNS